MPTGLGVAQSMPLKAIMAAGLEVSCAALMRWLGG